MKLWEWVFVIGIIVLFALDTLRKYYGPKPTPKTFQPIGMQPYASVSRRA